MSAQVWPYHRAECPECAWLGEWHLSPVSALDDANQHNADHALAEQVMAEVSIAAERGGGEIV